MNRLCRDKLWRIEFYNTRQTFVKSNDSGTSWLATNSVSFVNFGFSHANHEICIFFEKGYLLLNINWLFITYDYI